MLSDIQRQSPHVLGFLIEGQSGNFLAVEPGISVLYGLNGAGKSRTLADIRSFWAGTRSPVVALVRLPTSSTVNIDWNRETGRGDWYPDWARRAETSGGDEDLILTGWLEACLHAEEASIPGDPTQGDIAARRKSLIEGWLAQRLILVRATGTVEDRRWESAPAFLAGPDFPAAEAEADLCELIGVIDGWSDYETATYLDPICSIDGATLCSAAIAGTPVFAPHMAPFAAGQHDRLIDLDPSLHRQPLDVNERTKAYLAAAVPEPVVGVDGSAEPSPELVDRVRELEGRANRHYSGVLLDAPFLRLHVAPLGFGPQVEWYVENDDGPVFVPPDELQPVSVGAWERERRVSELSAAQARWARWSIDVAVSEAESGDVPRPRLVLLDEPEAALHRSAEARMAAYLKHLSTDGFSHLLVATHSPELLDLNGAKVSEIRRVHGRRRISELTTVTRDDMGALGLLPSDLLRRQRGFILVEGLHDEIVLDELFRETLKRLRVEVLPMRGTTELSPAKINFLLRYTPAHVFVLLDNIPTADLIEIWDRACDLYESGQEGEAGGALATAQCLTSDEGKKLGKVLTEALLSGNADRLTPFGLTHADVIEYLPVESLVPGREDWSRLRAEHAMARSSKKGTPRDFKAWLKAEHHANFDEHVLRSSLGRLDAVPPDFLRLLKTVEAHLPDPSPVWRGAADFS